MTGMPSAPQPSPAPLPEVGAADIVPVAATAPDPPRHEETIGDRDLRDWRSRTGRRLLRIFATLVIRGERIWRGWSLHLTVLAILPLVGAPSRRPSPRPGPTSTGRPAPERHRRPGPARSRLGRLRTGHRPPSHWVTDFTHIGGTVGGPIVALAVVGALVWAWRKRTPVLVMVPGLVGALLITVVGKDVTGQTRPPRRSPCRPSISASFPSGHTLNATVLAGLAAYLLLIVTDGGGWDPRCRPRLRVCRDDGALAGLARPSLAH